MDTGHPTVTTSTSSTTSTSTTTSTSPTPFRVGLAQIAPTGNPTENLEKVEAAVAAAAEAGTRLVILPEASMSRFGNDPREVAESFDGPFASRIAEIAATHGVTVVVGMFTPPDGNAPSTPSTARPTPTADIAGRSNDPGHHGAPGHNDDPSHNSAPGRVRNTLLVAGPDGVASYSKIHLFDAYDHKESHTIEPGTDPVTVEVDGVTVGLAICYDIRFPELFVRLAQQGAQVIVVPAAWGISEDPDVTAAKLESWRLLARARALDSTSWVVAVDQAHAPTAGVEEPEGHHFGKGHSLAVSPWGEVVAELGDGEGLQLVDIDLEQVDAARRALPVLQRRPLLD